MAKFAVIGLQNGDEGKGKFVEHLYSQLIESIDADKKILDMRYQGSSNAGHTVVVGDKKYALHQVPSAIVHPQSFNFLGTGVYLNVPKLREEFKILEKAGISLTPDNFGISSKAHIILPYHTIEDKANFNLEEHSSTGNGVRQVGRDKYDRIGIRVADIFDAESFHESFIRSAKVNDSDFLKNSDITNSVVGDLLSYKETIEPFVRLEEQIITSPEFPHIIFEGAQGVMLDVDKGQYPGITSSAPGSPPYRPNVLIAVAKLYQSSVGIKDRAFVAEMNEFSEEQQKLLRDAWGEYGTTTGKPRHIGWFDTLAANYALATTGADEIAGSCLDKLEALHEFNLPLKVVTGYKVNGMNFTEWDVLFDARKVLFGAEPMYKEFETWDKTLDDNGDLTPNARRYVDFLEDKLGKQFYALGVGPESTQTIVNKDITKQYID